MMFRYFKLTNQDRFANWDVVELIIFLAAFFSTAAVWIQFRFEERNFFAAGLQMCKKNSNRFIQTPLPSLIVAATDLSLLSANWADLVN